MNAKFGSGEYPDRNTEYLLYQTMVGAWPISRERIGLYMEKATREAKRMTSWISPDEDSTKHSKLFSRTFTSTKHFFRLFVSLLSLSLRRAHRIACAGFAEADDARRTRPLPGHGTLGPQPGRSR